MDSAATADSMISPPDSTEPLISGETTLSEETGQNTIAQYAHDSIPQTQNGQVSVEVCSPEADLDGTILPLPPRRKDSTQYGTFETSSRDNETAGRVTRSSTFATESKSSYEYTEKSSAFDSTVNLSSLNSKSTAVCVIHITQPVERSDIFSKAELDHLCYDASEFVKPAPDGAHWGKVLSTSLLCPACGLISLFYACRSSHRYRKGYRDSAQQMLRHSDFCFRMTVVSGILFWFFCYMVWVVYDWK